MTEPRLTSVWLPYGDDVGRDTVAAFTARERMLLAGGAHPRRWRARYAAKLAVLRAVGVPPGDDALRAVEVLPYHRQACADPYLCGLGHPLRAHLGGAVGAAAGADVTPVTISHDAGIAFAVALVNPGS
jgi:phosphopantetheinyl transferase (holo-ACP synthase)